MNKKLLKKLNKAGVIIINPFSVYIDYDAVIESGVIIYPNNYIYGRSVVKSGARLFSGNVIYSSVIEEGAEVTASHITSSFVGEGSKIGPNAHLRPSSCIGKNCKIGNFVEIKNSQICENTKIAHLAYVGDAEVGANCNIGCGVVFANYDGKSKHKTVVEKCVFIGSNSVLVAPLTLRENCIIAAGSVIVKDVPANALAIARARQENKENYK